MLLHVQFVRVVEFVFSTCTHVHAQASDTHTHVHVRGGQKVKQLLTLRAGAGLQIVGEGVSQSKGIVGDGRLLTTSGRAHLPVDLQVSWMEDR